MDSPTLTEQEVNDIYTWVDIIPLSRPKKNIGRDFADGVLMAEIVHHYFPKLVELHNYSQANSTQTKQYNWSTLNTKVLKKLGFQLAQKDIDSVIQVEDRAIERVLKIVQEKIKYFKENESQLPETQKSPSHHNSDQLQQSMTNEKDQLIQEQRETIGILELKITKLEQLVKLKDSKIQTLMQKLQQLGYKF
ncbi:unnamed protein product (macronuclear) [Paramecium tetraurelia]|uniref:Calponin-homology (CH) domain-containing protein n=1 Tax=Paramecium tetraurelia TaxID=5888 RepID=A0DC81_PARTE|nr:uncharacterized protein GSPATT00015526001 [Paramecium tetraurelia]CAK80648.1 unnamed protein product [Paramecium tetraurelia]|eukprot:XP_001448045.1 hypothetical protein (macronuclear) [Paramecium tetraurelia strain d4-2]